MIVLFKVIFYSVVVVAVGLHEVVVLVAGKNCSDSDFCAAGQICVDDSGDDEDAAFTLDNGTVVPYCTFVVPPSYVCGSELVLFPQDCPRWCVAGGANSGGTLYENVLNSTHSQYLCRCNDGGDDDNNGMFRNFAICAGTHTKLCFNGLFYTQFPTPCSENYTCVFYSDSVSYCTQDPDNVPQCLEYPGDGSGPIENGAICGDECGIVHGSQEANFYADIDDPPASRSLCRCKTKNHGLCASPFVETDNDDSANNKAPVASMTQMISIELEGISREMNDIERWRFMTLSSSFLKESNNGTSLLSRFVDQELTDTFILITSEVASFEGDVTPGETAVNLINADKEGYVSTLNEGWASLEATGVSAALKAPMPPTPTPTRMDSTLAPTMMDFTLMPPTTPSPSLPPPSASRGRAAVLSFGFIATCLALVATS